MSIEITIKDLTKHRQDTVEAHLSTGVSTVPTELKSRLCINRCILIDFLASLQLFSLLVQCKYRVMIKTIKPFIPAHEFQNQTMQTSGSLKDLNVNSLKLHPS